MASLDGWPVRLYRVGACGQVLPPDPGLLAKMGAPNLVMEDGPPKAHPLFVIHDCPSTQDLFLAIQRRYPLSPGASLLCHHQKQGRGQFSREWVSFPGNLSVTTLLAESKERLPLSLLLGAATVLALRQQSRNDVWLKWPNDLVLRRGQQWFKVGGMLLEQRAGYCYWGLGINLVSAPSLVLPDSLAAGILPHPLPPAIQTWLTLLPATWRTLALWSPLSSQTLIDCYLHPVLAFKNQPVAYQNVEQGTFQPGTLLGLNADGSALLETPEGRRIAHYSGAILPREIRRCNPTPR